jgi:hypothetical protein
VEEKPEEAGEADSTIAPTEEEKEEWEVKRERLEKIAEMADNLVFSTYSVLPAGSLFIVFTGNGNLHEIRRHFFPLQTCLLLLPVFSTPFPYSPFSKSSLLLSLSLLMNPQAATGEDQETKQRKMENN